MGAIFGDNTSTTTQNQTSNPYGPTIPGLQNLIAQLNSGGAPLTGAQSSAIQNLQNQAGQVQGFGAQGAGAVNNLFGSSVAPQVGMLGDAYSAFQAANSPYMNPNYTNPYSNPALSSALGTMGQDITNQIRGSFAASGRTGSPAESQALARGLSQGQGGLLANQYNQLVQQQQQAMGAGQGAAQSTAQGQANLNQIPLSNAVTGIQAAGALPGLYTAPGATQLTAANVAQQQPYQNMQLPASMLTGIAGLGGTQSGTSTTVQPVNDMATLASLGLAGASLFSKSDVRAKKDIQPIGLLYNGLPFYKFRYRGSDKLETGVMAQDVEKVMPDAVFDIGLMRGGQSEKWVNYERATGPLTGHMAMAA